MNAYTNAANTLTHNETARHALASVMHGFDTWTEDEDAVDELERLRLIERNEDYFHVLTLKGRRVTNELDFIFGDDDWY